MDALIFLGQPHGTQFKATTFNHWFGASCWLGLADPVCFWLSPNSRLDWVARCRTLLRGWQLLQFILALLALDDFGYLHLQTLVAATAGAAPGISRAVGHASKTHMVL